ncbi:LytTR family DNA-binding domain-containing protein [soil metagenome]
MGIFVFLFLLLFRPFGLYTLPANDVISILLGYGLLCMLILFFNLMVLTVFFPRFFSEESWTVWKQILFTLWNIVSIGLGNLMYSISIFHQQPSLLLLFNFQVITLLVAVLPVTIIVLFQQIRLMRKNLGEAKKISSRMHHKKRLGIEPELKITLRSENPKDNLELFAMELLFISAADNYIDVHFLEGELERSKLIRSTLKNAKEDLRNQNAFYRCHRGWIVNLDHVYGVTGNSQGYRLKVRNSEILVPVSRNLNNELSNRLSK